MDFDAMGLFGKRSGKKVGWQSEVGDQGPNPRVSVQIRNYLRGRGKESTHILVEENKQRGWKLRNAPSYGYFL